MTSSTISQKNSSTSRLLFYKVIYMPYKLYKFLKTYITLVISVFLVIQDFQAQNESASEIIEAIINSDFETAQSHELDLLKLDVSKENTAQHYLKIGDAFYRKEAYSRSRYYVDKAIHYSNMIKNDKLLSYAYLRLGNIFLQDWKNQEAIDAYYKSIDYSKKTKNLNFEALALTNSAIIFRRMKEYKKALKTCNSVSKSISASKNQINLITVKSEIHLDLKQIDSSLYSINKGIEMSKNLNYNAGLIDLYTKKGIVFCLKNDFENAKKYLINAEKVIQDNNIKNNKLSINLKYAKAHCFYEKGEYEKAILELNEVVKLFGDTINPERGRVLETYLLLSKSYKKLGLVDESEDWYDRHTQLKDKFETNQVKTLNKIYKEDNEYLDSEIEVLKKDKVKSKQKYTSILIVFSIGILTLILFLINYRRKQKSNKVLFDDLLKKINVLETTEYKSSTSTTKEVIIDDAKVAAIIKGLDRLEQQEYYLNYNCNLRSVAKKVKTNATYLSKIINTHKNKNFNDYINDLRIDYTIKRLKNNKQFRSFSIKSIATEVGYKSDYSFAKHFKAKTGFNPSYYIKQIEKLEAEIK